MAGAATLTPNSRTGQKHNRLRAYISSPHVPGNRLKYLTPAPIHELILQNVLTFHLNIFEEAVATMEKEVLVRDEEDRTKTDRSTRDVKMFPMVVEALKRQKKQTHGKSPYVFLNKYGRPLRPCPTRKVAWTPALGKADLAYRTMMHTRHTFITMMLDNREHIGWIARQVGHTSPKMILERYYSYIKDYQSEDGQRFMEMVGRLDKKKSGKIYPISTPLASGEKDFAA